MFVEKNRADKEEKNRSVSVFGFPVWFGFTNTDLLLQRRHWININLTNSQ